MAIFLSRTVRGENDTAVTLSYYIWTVCALDSLSPPSPLLSMRKQQRERR